MSWRMCLALVLVLLAGLALPLPGLAQEEAWEPVAGPYGGSVAAIAISPAYPTDHMAFAGLRSQGVYRTVNGGKSWQHAGPDGWRSVVALALSPAFAEDRTLFATSGLWTSGYDVHRSVDEGESWQEITPAWTGLPAPPGLAISPDFALDRTLYVVGGYQTFVSTDGGDTFAQPGGWFATHPVTALAFSPAYAVDRTLFALVSGEGLYKSVDGGVAWDLADPGVPVSTFAVSPNYGQDATLLAVGLASGQLYVSNDGGAFWSPGTLTLDPNGQYTLLFSPTFSPGDPVILAASSTDPGPYRSEDGGVTWTPVGWYDPANPYWGGFVGGSVAGLVLAPAGSWDAAGFAATSSGIYYSNDRGIHWYRHDSGPARLTVRALAVAPGDPQTILAGTSFFEHLRIDTGTPGEYDGGLQISYDGGQTWNDVSGRLEQVQDVAFSPAFQDDGTAFATAGTLGQHGYADGGAYRSIDGGQNWDEIIEDRICHALAVSPAFATDRTAWVSESTYSSNLGLFVTGDGGDTWTSLAPTVHATVLVPSPNYAVDHILFAGTQDAGLQRSADGGLSWTQVLTKPVTSLAVSPAFGASQTLYAGVRADPPAAGELVRSTDGGDSWQVLNTGIPPTVGDEPLTLSSLIFARDGSVLAGAYYGIQNGGAVYRSVDGGDTWQPVGSGLDTTGVLALAAAPVGSMTFYAGTKGGLWQIDVPQGGPAEPGTWEGNGPRGGRALALAVSPDFVNDGTALTGEWIDHKGGGQSGLGIFRSDDQGQTWQPSSGGTENVSYASALHDFAFSPDFAVDRIVFAATWGGLFRSTDGGQTWAWVGRLYSGPPGSINNIAVAPDFATSGHVMATGGWGGLYLSQDGGIHWTANFEVPTSGPIAYSPAFALDSTAFVAGWDGLYRTASDGANWTRVLTTSLSSLAVSPGFAADGTILAGGGGVVYISHDGGTSWISATLPVTFTFVADLAVSPAFATDQTVYAGTSAGLFESHDSGVTWAPVAGYPGLAVHSLAISPGWPAHPVLLAGTDRGVYRSVDGGVTWQLAQELSTLSSGPLALSPDDGLLIAGAYRRGVYGSLDGGAIWSALGLQSMTHYGVQSVAVSPAYDSDHTLFAALVSQESIGANVYRTQDGGATWKSVYSTGWISGLAISPFYGTDRTLFATVGSQVVRSQDNGDTWSTLGTWPPGATSPALLVAAPPGGAVLAAGDGFWFLPPGATMWEPAASGLVTGLWVSSLAISPSYNSDHTLLATASWTDAPSGETRSGVWRSADSGVNWELASTGLPGNGIRRVVFSPGDGAAYAISQHDLYRSLDGGWKWTTVGHPAVESTLRDLVVGHDGSVYVATQKEYWMTGDGVWRYQTPARDVVVDGGFEASSGWEFPQTAWPARVTDRVAYDGKFSARVGVDNGLNSQTVYSSARQVVAIPADALTATLSCVIYPVSGESTLRAQGEVLPDPLGSPAPDAGDSQYLLVLDPDSGDVLDTLFRQLSNAQRWQRYTFDLSGYRGRSVKLHFGVVNDAAGGRTAMYVDDVSLVIYRPAPAIHYHYLPLVLKDWP